MNESTYQVKPLGGLVPLGWPGWAIYRVSDAGLRRLVCLCVDEETANQIAGLLTQDAAHEVIA